MKLIIKETDDGENRATGVGRNLISASNSLTYETSESELSTVFEGADADELAGTDEPIEAAIDDPLAYRDFLILEDGEIVFDESYAREGEE